MKFAIFCNPTARRGNPKEQQLIVDIATQYNAPINILDDPEGVIPVLCFAQDAQCDTIILVGGDGTIRNFTQKVLEKENDDLRTSFSILPLPCGTMNLISQLTFRRAAQPISILEMFLRGELIPLSVPTICVEQEGKKWFGFFLILGPVARVIDQKYDQNHTPTKAYFTMVTACLAGLVGWPASFRSLYDHMSIRMVVDGVTAPQHQTLGVIISPFQKILFGFQPFMYSENGDLRLMSYDMKPRELVTPWIFPKVAYGKVKPDGIKYINTTFKQVEMVTGENCMCLDGNSYPIEPRTPLRISVGPSVTFLGRST